MKNFFRRILAVVLSCTFCFAVGCENEQSGSAENLEWFSVHAHEKILRNKDYENKTDKTLDITLCKNEYEGTQLILNAKSDIKEYDVEISALVSENAVFNSDNVKIYNEKYIKLLHKKGSNPVCENGDEIADAILPFDTAKEYKENYVDAGMNQGIYIEVNTDESTVAGTYTGTVTITADGQKYYAPIRVTVYDIVLPLQSQAQNFWNNVFYTQYGTSEMDTTDNMTEIYLNKMLEYKLNGTLPFSGNGGAEAYVELIKEYYHKPGFSCYQFYYEGGRTSYTYKDRETGEWVTESAYFNSALLKEYVMAVAEASVEDRVNYLDKAMFYFLTIKGADEPTTEEAFLRSTEIAHVVKMILQDVAYELKDALIGTESYTYYMETVFDTVLGIDLLLTVTGNTIRGEMESRDAEYTYCPNIGCINTEDMREYYAGEGDWWFYTSNSPYYPTATHHLDDMYTSLISLGWIQKAYDIKGYLNWNVADYLERGYNAYTVDQVSYFSPGDGWIFYPGYEYGLNEPVGSLRAVALRDGIDDYDLFTVMEEEYQRLGFSEEETLAVVNTIFEKFVTDTTPEQSTSIYEQAKAEIYENIFNSDNDFGLLVCGKEYIGGNMKITFDTVNSSATVSYEGQTLTKTQDGRYELTVNLAQKQSLTFTVTLNGESKDVVKNVGNAYQIAESFESGSHSFRVNASSQTSVQTDERFVYDGEQSLKISLGTKLTNTIELKDENNDVVGYEYVYEEVFITFGGQIISSLLEKKADELELLIYNDSAYELSLTLQGFNGKKYSRISDYKLKPGWNSILFKNATKLCETYSFNQLRLKVNSFVGDMQADIYVDALAFLTKGE